MTAIKSIFIGQLMAIFMSLMFTVIIGSICAPGLWIFSFIKPLNIEFVLSEKSQ